MTIFFFFLPRVNRILDFDLRVHTSTSQIMLHRIPRNPAIISQGLR